MRVEVFNIYSEQTETFTGTPEQVRAQLLTHYDFLKRYGGATLQEDLGHLARQQALFVKVDE